jgi:lipid-A-disaccharide synthase
MDFAPFSWQNRFQPTLKANGHKLSVPARKIVIVTGELSGEHHAAHLVENLTEHFSFELNAIGSTTLAALGVNVFHDYHDISLVGFEILTKIGHIRNAYQALRKHLVQNKPDLVILVDFPGFNLGLVSRLTKKLAIPTVYFIPPQIWAWRMGRINQIRERIDLVLCIFPFEENLYRSHGVPAHYVGHPYVRTVKPKYSKEEFCQRVGIDGQQHLITVMPGSRPGEISKHLPFIREVLNHLDNRIGKFKVLLPIAESIDENLLVPLLKNRQNIVPIKGLAHDCLAHCDGALIKSGSTTLEAAILGTPSVVFYKMSWISYRIGRALARVPFVSLPNIIANKLVFPEFIQNLDPPEIANALVNMIENGAFVVRKDIDRVRDMLTSDGRDPYQVATKHILQFLEQKYGTLPKTP